MAGDRILQFGIASTIHAVVVDPAMSNRQRRTAAALARRLADCFKRADRSFCYEWFYGACGLDPWGDLVGRPGTG